VPDYSAKKTLVVAFCVCIVCSVLVSATAISLQGIQEENRKLDRIRNILLAGNLLTDDVDIGSIYQEKVRPVMIELSTGDRVPRDQFTEILNIEDFDIRTMARDSVYGRKIPTDTDTAGIKRMPKYMPVYFIEHSGKTEKVVLPVYGKGLWSTMFGFVALGNDLTTVKGFTIYEHAETPGLGGEVDNPRWKESWNGKQIFDGQGNVKIKVIKGRVDPARPEAKYQIDGLSGATLTSRGVDNLVTFWLGENGYGPLLKRLRGELHGQI
jgi:Na+-transporting NADH:ubiquinone oxidoreductase subunit C